VNQEKQWGTLRDVPSANSPDFVDIPDELDYEPYEPPPPVPTAEARASYFVQSVQALLGRAPPESTSDSPSPLPLPESDIEPDAGRAPAPEEEPESDAPPPPEDESSVAEGLISDEVSFGPRAAFAGAPEFDTHRDDLKRFYQNLSGELGMTGTVQLCEAPACVNLALPNKTFCFAHVAQDPDFPDMRVFRQCKFAADGQRCPHPVSPKDVYCNAHRLAVGQPS
jgi:hypothetical protein